MSQANSPASYGTEASAGADVSEFSTNESEEASLLSRQDSWQDDAMEDDPQQTLPATPDDYQITFADDVNVNDVTLKSFKAKAHELGIPQGQAQKLVDFYVQNESQRSTEQLKAAAAVKQDWEQTITSSPTFRQDAISARKTLIEFGSFGAVNERGEPAIDPEIKNIFDESLVGSHPKVFQMFVNIGKALAEPEVRGRGVGSGRDKPLADRLWPNMK